MHAVQVGRRLPEEEERELGLKVPFRREALETISESMFSGLVRQLTSFPVDLRVEREISQELPEHQERQLALLLIIPQKCDTAVRWTGSSKNLRNIKPSLFICTGFFIWYGCLISYTLAYSLLFRTDLWSLSPGRKNQDDY